MQQRQHRLISSSWRKLSVNHCLMYNLKILQQIPLMKKCEHFAQDKRPGSEKRNSVLTWTNTDSAFPFLRKANSDSRGLNKINFFMSEIAIRPECCQPCDVKTKIGKIAMRYKVCKIICHPKCKSQLPLACIPLPLKNTRWWGGLYRCNCGRCTCFHHSSLVLWFI